jgi:hypothetical protein
VNLEPIFEQEDEGSEYVQAIEHPRLKQTVQ